MQNGTLRPQPAHRSFTDKKENKIFLIYKEIQSGAVAKSYMRKGFLIYEKMRKYFPIYEEAVSHIWLCNCSILNFLIYMRKIWFSFLSVFGVFLFITLSLYYEETRAIHPLVKYTLRKNMKPKVPVKRCFGNKSANPLPPAPPPPIAASKFPGQFDY